MAGHSAYSKWPNDVCNNVTSVNVLYTSKDCVVTTILVV